MSGRRDCDVAGARLGSLGLEAHLRDPHIKQRFVTAVFEVVAQRYDRFTTVFSYGMDRGWKRELLERLAATRPAPGLVLDVACGTGDLAVAAAQLPGGPLVLGLDVSRSMLRTAHARRHANGGKRVHLAAGDMMQLPLADGSADVVTVGYGIRNAPDPSGALDEITRVLRRDGYLLVLDFYRPRNPVWRALFLGYLGIAGRMLGWLWHRDPVAYGYIAASIEHYLSWQEFGDALASRGLAVERVSRKLLGGICLHVARKLAESSSRPSPRTVQLLNAVRSTHWT